MFNCIVSNISEAVKAFPNDPESFWIQEPDGTVIGVFLIPGTRYCLHLKSGALEYLETSNASISYSLESLHLYASPLHLQKPVADLVILHSPEEYLWTDSYDAEFWTRLFSKGLFALPHAQMVLVPNPFRKYAIELDCEAFFRKSKSMKELSFEFSPLVVDAKHISELKCCLIECRNWHVRFGKSRSSWITSKFIETVSEMVGESNKVKFHIFKLIDIDSGQVAALSLGFRKGNAFMDFTACTLKRDKRSCGKLLLALQGEWLKSNGVQLWYLGFKLAYMQSVSHSFRELDRSTFQKLWDHCSSS